MEVPRSVIRFNRYVNNPIQGQYAWLLPPWAVVVHRGRRSGRTFRTPLIALKKGRTISLTILYGERTDWVRNVLAGGGELVRGGRTYPLLDPRVADAATAPEISRAARRYGRISGRVLVAELGAPEPGFGRGPKRTR